MKKLFYNGEVITVDKASSIHQAIMIEDDKITFVGSTHKALKYIDEETETVDLNGCAVLPGFIDCHIHMAVAEAKSGKEIMLTSKDGIKTVSDILEKIKRAVKEALPDEWIVGSGYSQEELSEMRHITLSELDEIAPHNPVMLVHKSGHMSVCNSSALKLAEKDRVKLPDEHVDRDKNGKETGLLKEAAHFMMLEKSPLLPDDEVLISGIEKFCKRLLRAGITSSHDAGGFATATYRSLQKARDLGVLKNRVYTMLWTLFGKEAQIENAKDAVKSGFYTGFGDEMLKKGPIKIMADGSAVGGTCATYEPILTKNEIFPTSFTQQELDEIFISAHRAGFQLTAHAAGDRAIEMVLNSYEKAMELFPRKDPRHRIEHCFLCPERLMPRIKKLGVLPIPNPGFISVWGNVFEKYYGNRLNEVIPLKRFEECGIITPFGSDALVIEELEPLFGVAAAMERCDLSSDRVIGEEQKIGFMRALKGYTYFGAYASFEEKIKGSLEVGKLADLVVLSNSILGKTPKQIRKILVAETYIGGKNI
ncbi:MAG: amidohydrolase [Clostridia bacterium]|nr:amidohydrolase [Clostridia bacterium]